jgi:hypothetical protein
MIMSNLYSDGFLFGYGIIGMVGGFYFIYKYIYLDKVKRGN